MINCFIQARSSSSRLPGKIMLPVNGIPLLVGLWQRLRACEQISETVILLPNGDKAEITEANVFHGPEEDVARRFSLALAMYPCEGFVRVCADSPFLSPLLVDIAALACRTSAYTLISGGRSGLQCEAFRTRDFVSSEPYMTGDEREHIGLFFKRGRSLAVDTQEDYERLKDIPL